jgi:FkbM family methyltransferase
VISKNQRAQLKRIVPGPIWLGVRRAVTFLRRLIIWRAVMNEIVGAREDDQAVLRLSFRRGIIAALGDLDHWQDPELVENAAVTVVGVGRFEVRARTDDLYHVLPSREIAVAEAIRNHLHSESTFIDAGANIGFYTVLGSQLVSSSGRVIAIEMMPETADRLRQHIRLNELSNVTVLEHALSDRNGNEIEVPVPEHKHGQASILADRRPLEAHRNIRLSTRTLDDLLSATGWIDLIKMDLESAEPLALAGATEVLTRTGAVIFEQLADESTAAELLIAAGFTLNHLDATNVIAIRAVG